MNRAKPALGTILTLLMLLAVTVSGCGIRETMHQRSILCQQEIERRQLELDCLKRQQADSTVDCSAFKR